VSSGTVTTDADGYVPVTLTCELPVPCKGAVVLWLEALGAEGRSDLLVEAGTTRTIAVPLPASALAFLRSDGPTSLMVNADNGLVPPCGEIAQLAASCAEFTQAPGYEVRDGDGIDRIIAAELTVAAPG
jgi:hypothetical protein